MNTAVKDQFEKQFWDDVRETANRVAIQSFIKECAVWNGRVQECTPQPGGRHHIGDGLQSR